MGLMASKNARCPWPTNAAMSAESASDVSGPVATMSGDISEERGRCCSSRRSTRILGCAVMAAVTPAENTCRSTARAAPAGTRASSAIRMMSDPIRRISSLRRPTALSSLSPRNELLQTSSASASVWCTAVGRTGRISYSVTSTSMDAACQAASLPASPPPMMCTMDLPDRRLFERLAAHVVALLVAAEDLAAMALCDLFRQEQPITLGARLEDRLVPQGEIALRIVHAPVEHLASTRLAFRHVPAALGTLDARQLLLDVLALGVAGAGGEFAEPALLDHQVFPAVRTEFVENLIGFRGGHALSGGDDFARGLTFRVARARQEHAEPAPLEDHR